MKGINIFKHERFGELRIFATTSDIWFAGKEVSEILAYRSILDMTSRLNDDAYTSMKLSNMDSCITMINESAFDDVINQSESVNASAFKQWILLDIVPELWKEKKLSGKENESMITIAKRGYHSKEDDSGLPEPKETFDMGEVAKIINIEGYGRNNLFTFLRKKRVLMWDNEPYQSYVDRGWFRMITQTHYRYDGEHETSKVMVYRKGIRGIRRMIMKEEGLEEETACQV